MPFSLSDLLKKSTRDEMVTELLELAASFGLPTTSWQSGAVVRTMILIFGQKLADFSAVAVEIAKGGLGDFVSDDWAPLWAKQTFDVDIIEAEPATGAVDAANASLTQYDLQPGELIVAHSVTGKTYRNQAAISILASVGLAGIAIQADEVGTGADAAPGTITRLVSSQVGVSVTNPAPVLGADRETTDALVARSRKKLGSLSSMGPKAAYDYVATTPELAATSTPVTRSRTIANPATGAVTVYVATADGAPSGGDVAIVQAAEDKWAEPWCVTSTATAANEVVVAVTCHVWVKTNLTALQVQNAVATALAEYFKLAPIGGFVVPPDTGDIYVEELERVIGEATPGIQKVSVSAPASDVTFTAGDVPKLGVVTTAVTLL